MRVIRRQPRARTFDEIYVQDLKDIGVAVRLAKMFQIRSRSDLVRKLVGEGFTPERAEKAVKAWADYMVKSISIEVGP